MDLTVVIRCGDDYRVFDCIESIDEEVEVIVSTSANKELETALTEKGIKYVLSPRKNLSKTSNIGFYAAKYDKVFITDSDTLFEPGCLKQIYEGLDRDMICRAKINFLIDSEIKTSKIIAEARDFVNSLDLLYTPGIGVKKGIEDLIGGFLFDENAPYAVDANLDFRVKYHKIPYNYIKTACIQHRAESYKHDLKAAKRIGRGTAISTLHLKKLGYKVKFNALKGVKIKSVHKVLFQKGIAVFFYQLIWDLFYYYGHFKQLIFGNRNFMFEDE